MSEWLEKAKAAAAMAHALLNRQSDTPIANGWVELGRLYTELHYAENVLTTFKAEEDLDHQVSVVDANLPAAFPQEPTEGQKHTDGRGVIFEHKDGGWEVWDNTSLFP